MTHPSQDPTFASPAPVPQGTLPPQGPQGPQWPQAPQPDNKNRIGNIALVLAIIGFVFACIPGALIIGWILLPAAFIMSLVGLAVKDKPRKSATWALVLSIIGTIAGFTVFAGVVEDAFDEAFNDQTSVERRETTRPPRGTTAPEPSNEPSAEPTDEPEPSSPEGTRSNPLPLGSEIWNDEWHVVVNGVDLDALEAVRGEYSRVDDPADGHVYVLVNITATYTGSDPNGDSPWVFIDYVTPSGNTIDSEFSLFTPDALDRMSTLYEGASTTGNVLFELPVDGLTDGVLAVQVDLFADKAFFAMQ